MLIGIHEVSLGTVLQKFERDHAQLGVYFEWKTADFVAATNDPLGEKKDLATKLINDTSEIYREMGLLQLAKSKRSAAAKAVENTLFIERLVLKLAGFGEILFNESPCVA